MKIISVLRNKQNPWLTFHDIKSQFDKVVRNGTFNGDDKGEMFRCILVQGRFLAFSTVKPFVQDSENLQIFVWAGEQEYHIGRAVGIMEIMPNLIFVGGGYIYWQGEEFCNKASVKDRLSKDFQKEMYSKMKSNAHFDSESCLDHFGYDRPTEGQEFVIRLINETVEKIRDETFSEFTK